MRHVTLALGLFIGALVSFPQKAFCAQSLDAPKIPIRSPSKAVHGAASAEDEFVIKKPGEITFTTGIVIEGRVEKPQVMLILTKERVKIEPLNFEQSFVRNITEPMRYNTFEAYNAQEDRPKSEDLPGQKRKR